METRRRNRGAFRFIVAAVIALSSTFVAAPVATATENCDKTPVHKLLCDLVDRELIETVRDVLCAASSDLCV